MGRCGNWALAFLVIQQIESNVLLPRLSAHAVGIHPIGSILALILAFEVGGILGALFAVPQTIGWPGARSSSRTRRALRQLRPR